MEEFLLKYNIIYWVAGFLVFLMALKLDIRSQWDRSMDNINVAIVLVGFTFLFGLRSIEVGADTWNYLFVYDKLGDINDLPRLLKNVKGDLLFYLFTYCCARYIGSPQAYLTLIAILYLVPVTMFIYRVTPTRRSLLLLAFISFFFFQSMGVNVIRNGVALAFVLLSLVLDKKQDRFKRLLCMLIACLFHLSAVLVLLCVLFTRLVKKNWIYYGLLLFCSAVAIAGYGLNNIPYVGGVLEFDRISTYAGDTGGVYVTGFKPQFWAFNIFFVVFAGFYRPRLNNPFYTRVSRLFMLLSAFFFLCFNLSYSDRFGLLSWIFIPLIIYYPFTTYRITYQFQHVLLLMLLVCFRLFSVIYFSN